MKLNWGTSVVLALAGFIAFIMFFFIKAQFIKQDDLVTEEYYDEGLLHDVRNEWKTNAMMLSSDLVVEKDQEGNLIITIPAELKGLELEGNLQFSRSDNAKLDVIRKFSDADAGVIYINSNQFLIGNYRLKAKLTALDKSYYWDRNYTY